MVGAKHAAEAMLAASMVARIIALKFSDCLLQRRQVCRETCHIEFANPLYLSTRN
jgi:hypothetical protein